MRILFVLAVYVMICNDSDTVSAAGATESDADSEHERRFCEDHQEHHERYIDTSRQM